MRKLPVFILIDISESMAGESLEMVNKGMEFLLRSLKQNPYALETVWIELLAFAGKAGVLESYEELAMFYPPNLPIGGGTALGAGLDLLMNRIDTNVKRSSLNQRGDWKPLVFIFTDGQPTDDYMPTLKRWESNYKPNTITVTATLGDCYSNSVLSMISENALRIEDAQAESFETYFKWISDSVAASSQQVSVSMNQTEDVFAKPSTNKLSFIDLTKRTDFIKDEQVILFGACQNTQEKYLIKYRKSFEIADHLNEIYLLDSALKIDYARYKEWTKDFDSQLKIDVGLLQGIPTCPYCNSKHAFVVCQCGGIFCYNENTEMQKCAWCDRSDYYAASSRSFDINRRQG
ncbi:MAG: VWA domain-containing protein [Marinifilaceae bacterium]|jgi:uncharacterized protein YegL|nr:VWA domain-containing protein [Marinifilaceae bacterium]